ncbi:MAG: hypothetical protein K5829_00665 [Treponema sp.]|nr:hypothetical protein [Treponema sp.]
MNYLKNKLIIILFFFSYTSLFSDPFIDLIQDLAMQTACIGQYSITQAGGGWYEDPHDYYTPQMLAERFKYMSGERTRTTTFYGVCFDYAQAAWDDIKAYQSLYNQYGMKGQQWYIAAVDNDPNVITLYDPVSESKADLKMNGVFLKKNSTYRVRVHGNATRHAWLWIQHQDGTWYWIDPTWTDNCGYVRYGKVFGNYELELLPDSKYCVILPPLPELPELTPQDNVPKPTPSPAPQPQPAPQPYYPTHSILHDGDYDHIVEIGYARPISNLIPNQEELLLSLCYGDGNSFDRIGFFQLDYYNYEQRKDLLLGASLGIQVSEVFAFYAGGGGGYDFNQGKFDWKLNGGARLIIYRVPIRIDVAWQGQKNVLVGIYTGYCF